MGPPSCSPFPAASEEADHDVEVHGHENCPSSVHGPEAGVGPCGMQRWEGRGHIP